MAAIVLKLCADFTWAQSLSYKDVSTKVLSALSSSTSSRQIAITKVMYLVDTSEMDRNLLPERHSGEAHNRGLHAGMSKMNRVKFCKMPGGPYDFTNMSLDVYI